MITWKEKLQDILTASQESTKSHERLLNDLREIYDSVDTNTFSKEFASLLVHPLSFDEKSGFVDTCLSFIANFVVGTVPEESQNDEDDDSDESARGTTFFLDIVDFLTKILPSTNKTVRLRGCQLLRLLLKECATQRRSHGLTGEYWDRLVAAIGVRCKDKIMRVRFNAVSALLYLQQPDDKDCLATTMVLFLMRYDPSAEIRSLCVRVVSTTKPTIAALVDRCRDVNDTVRRNVFVEVSKRMMFRHMTIAQRVALLKQGLTDRVDSVRTTCERQVLENWLETVDDDIPHLLRRLDLVTSKETCELVLDALFQQKAPSELAAAFGSMTESWEQDEWMTPERVFCLRYFVRFINLRQKSETPKLRFDANDVEEWLEQLLPSLYLLVEFVEKYIMKDVENLDDVDLIQRNFVVDQLLELLALADKSDAAGRNRLQKMLDSVGPVVSASAYSSLVRLHSEMYQNIGRMIEWMADVISELTAAPTPAQHVANDNLDRTLNFDNLLFDENAIDDARITSNLFKSLTILSEVLKLAEVKTLATTLRSLYENLVLPAIQYEDPATRNLAFRCLGLICLLDGDLASSHIALFLQTLKVDVAIVRKTATEVLFDLIQTFPAAVSRAVLPESDFDANGSGMSDKKKNTTNVVVSEMLKILDSDDTELHDVVAEGLAKLSVAQRP